MTEESVLRRWKEYFEDSINEKKREGKMRVQAEWSRWRKLSEMIYDRRITA